MNIFVFSDSKKITAHFDEIKKSKNISLQFAHASELKKTVKIAPPGSLIYADISSYDKAEIPHMLKFLAGLKEHRYGIIDTKGGCKDIAGLFHNSASDYIGKDMARQGITRKRLERVMEFKKLETGNGAPEAINKRHAPAGGDWKKIKPGSEYAFSFMFVELDKEDEIKGLGAEQFSRITGMFRRGLEELILPLNGRIWIWNDLGGLILFPFNGKNCDAVETAFRLMVSRRLLGAEMAHHDIGISYRIAMHIGSTVYQTSGKTGTIVSDSINSTFHLGQKFAKPGNLYITKEVFLLSPAGLKDYFTKTGTFEGRDIMRMRRVL